jgi:hypothetical protein
MMARPIPGALMSIRGMKRRAFITTLGKQSNFIVGDVRFALAHHHVTITRRDFEIIGDDFVGPKDAWPRKMAARIMLKSTVGSL